MKILLVASELPPARSGVAAAAELLSKHYRRMGHHVETITMRGLPKLVWGELRLSFFFLRWPSIRRDLRRYDCVHLHGPAPTFSDLFLLLARLTMRKESRPKIVYTHHFDLDLPGVAPLCRLYNWFHAGLIRGADAVVVTTRTYKRLLLKRGHQAVSVIPWGSDHRARSNARRPPGGFDVLAVAQMRPYKGLDVLLRAFRRLSNARLHIVGDGHSRGRLEALAARLGLAGVRFYGSVSDAELERLFASCHVVALSSISRMEAFGISLIEGMRAGAVPVASDLPGVAEVVGRAGKLVPPANADELAEALLELQQDRDLWEQLSVRARRRAASFRWDDTAEKYIDLLERLVGDRDVFRQAG